jgi:hypothetical protein
MVQSIQTGVIIMEWHQPVIADSKRNDCSGRNPESCFVTKRGIYPKWTFRDHSVQIGSTTTNRENAHDGVRQCIYGYHVLSGSLFPPHPKRHVSGPDVRPKDNDCIKQIGPSAFTTVSSPQQR